MHAGRTGPLSVVFNTVYDSSLPTGSFTVWLALDLYSNGTLDLPYVWNDDLVDTTVLP